MKKFFLFILVLVAVIWGITQLSKNRKPLGSVNNGAVMQISSSAFANNSLIPDTYTCSGQGVNPPLEFSGISPDARSLALIIDDPDAGSRPYTHWVIYNIPPRTSGISQNSKPQGILVKNSSGLKDYVALCPTSGEHTYTFTLYAVDMTLPADTITNKADLLDAISGHTIDQARLFGKFTKK